MGISKNDTRLFEKLRLLRKEQLKQGVVVLWCFVMFYDSLQCSMSLFFLFFIMFGLQQTKWWLQEWKDGKRCSLERGKTQNNESERPNFFPQNELEKVSLIIVELFTFTQNRQNRKKQSHSFKHNKATSNSQQRWERKLNRINAMVTSSFIMTIILSCTSEMSI